jgi:DNA-binding response OmpR family regulator
MKTPNKSILLVEDHQELAETVGAYLEASGYIVDYATDGLTAMHLGVTNIYEAIVLDVMLPGVDGLTVCRRLRDDANVTTPYHHAHGSRSAQRQAQGLRIWGRRLLNQAL